MWYNDGSNRGDVVMNEQERKVARIARIEKRIANLEQERGKITADIRKDMKEFNRRKRLTALVRAGLVIERAGLLSECQSESFREYLENYGKARGDAHGD